jgi:uncharacterized caspase-like protein
MKWSTVCAAGLSLASLWAGPRSWCAQQDAGRGVTVEPVMAEEGGKWALLIGANNYADRRLGALSYCEADVEGLKRTLVLHAAVPANRAIVLHDKQPEPKHWPLRQVIEQTLEAFLPLPGPNDQVLIGISLHGTHLDGTSYLCPMDADLDKPAATLLRVSWLYETLETRCKAAQKVLIIDACRREPRSQRRAAGEPEAMSRGLSQALQDVPRGIVALSSCTAGQLSYEDADLGHGVFMHFVLRGLSGSADQRGANRPGNGDGRVDVSELFQYAAAETQAHVVKQHRGGQTPELYGTLTGPIFLAQVDAAATITDSVSEPSDFRQAVALAKVAVRQAEADDMPSAQITFRNALGVVERIEDDFLGDLALAEIVKAQAKAGDITGALKTAGRISDKSRYYGVLRELALERARAGDATWAYRICGAFPRRATGPISVRNPIYDEVAAILKEQSEKKDDR